jgi:hypothetical protein
METHGVFAAYQGEDSYALMTQDLRIAGIGHVLVPSNATTALNDNSETLA